MLSGHLLTIHFQRVEFKYVLNSALVPAALVIRLIAVTFADRIASAHTFDSCAAAAPKKPRETQETDGQWVHIPLAQIEVLAATFLAFKRLLVTMILEVVASCMRGTKRSSCNDSLR